MSSDEGDRPSESDRDAFEARVKAEMKSRGLSGRQLESRIGMATGTLSKIFRGRLRLKLKELREIAGVLQVGPETLVYDTAFHDLLLGAPETPESKELAEARAEVDRLRVELVGRDAVIERQRAEAEALRKELAVERTNRIAAEARDRAAQFQLKAAQDSNAEAVRQHQQAAFQLLVANRTVEKLTQSGAGRDASERQTLVQLEAMRKRAGAAESRVAYLERELTTLQRRAQQQEHDAAGRTLAAGLAALGIGAALGSQFKT